MIYGLVHPLATWDPLWAQVHVCVYIVTSPSLYGGDPLCAQVHVCVYIVTSPSLYGGDPLWAQVHVCTCIYSYLTQFVWGGPSMGTGTRMYVYI